MGIILMHMQILHNSQTKAATELVYLCIYVATSGLITFVHSVAI